MAIKNVTSSNPVKRTIVTHLKALTKNEQAVIRAAIAASARQGHDFGILDEVIVEGKSVRSIAGTMVSLERKNLVELCEPERVNGEHLVQQFYLRPHLLDAVFADQDEEMVREDARRMDDELAAAREQVSAMSVDADAPVSMLDKAIAEAAARLGDLPRESVVARKHLSGAA